MPLVGYLKMLNYVEVWAISHHLGLSISLWGEAAALFFDSRSGFGVRAGSLITDAFHSVSDQAVFDHPHIPSRIAFV